MSESRAPARVPRDARDKFYAGFAGIEWDKWDKWDSAGRGMAAQAVILARHWYNFARRGPLALARHGAILAAESRAVHRTKVRGVRRSGGTRSRFVASSSKTDSLYRPRNCAIGGFSASASGRASVMSTRK